MVGKLGSSLHMFTHNPMPGWHKVGKRASGKKNRYKESNGMPYLDFYIPKMLEKLEYTSTARERIGNTNRNSCM